MKIISLRVGPIRTNCFLVASEGEIGVIDPGDEAQKIVEEIKNLGGKVVWVISTHGHFDHLLAADKVASFYTVPYYLSPKDKPTMEQTLESARWRFGIEGIEFSKEITPIEEGMQIILGEAVFEVWETPGHSPGSICLYCRKEDLIFCGDLVFSKGVIGKTDTFGGDAGQSKNSIERVLSLSDGTHIYPAHGRDSFIGDLKQTLKEVAVF